MTKQTIAIGVAVTLTVCSLCFIAHDMGVKAGEFKIADEFFRYCFDHGGVLTNMNTGEKIGCMAVIPERGDPV